MNIIAFIPRRLDYFNEVLGKLSQPGFEVLPLYFYELLFKFDKNRAFEELGFFWDSFFSSSHYDALWSYNLPDELTTSKCRQYGVPVLIQEFYGHFPERLPAIVPMDMDFIKHYGENTDETGKPDGRKSSPVITIALGIVPYSDGNTIPSTINRSNFDGKVPISSFWKNDGLILSNLNFIASIFTIFENTPEFSDCILKVRIHPKYPDLFINEISYVQKLNNPRIGIDDSASPFQSLETSDIVICIDSNFGFDALRAGAEVITYGGKAFYGNPQLSPSPKNAVEFQKSLIEAVGKIKTRGRKQKPFMTSFIADLKNNMSCPCEKPYDIEKIKNSIQHVLSIPLIRAEKT